MADIKKILSKMTIDEKIGQLMQYNAHVLLDTSAEITGPMMHFGLKQDDLAHIGSVLNFGSAEEARELQKKHLEADPNKIPLLLMMDVIHGYRTIYPVPIALGASFDPSLVSDCSRVAAREASAGGIHVTFAPMVDYVRDARWGRVMETFSEDAGVNGIMGAAQVRGFQGEDLKDSDNIATCVKHFAAYGGAEAGRDYAQVDLSEHTLREHYLPAYKACIDAGVTMLMTSFNSLNGVPSTANSYLMQDILRKEWGYDGVVISDYNAVGELMVHGVAENEKETARLAFENTCDIEMCSSAYCHNLKSLIEEGVFTEKQLDEAVLRVLKLKDDLGLFENPYRNASETAESDRFLTEENRAVARRAAEESAVLLKNDGILPLSKNTKKIALIGPFADNKEIIGSWACNGRNEESVTIKEGIEKLLPDAQITVATGCSNLWDDYNTDGFCEAIEVAKKADVVILCVGEHQHYSGESFSRTELTLTGVQEKLCEEIVKVNKNTVAVTFSGRPLVLNRVDKTVPAILHMWFPGTEGGSAVANLLFGDANPCGKVPMSFPKAVGQCPIYYNHTSTGRPKGTPEGVFHGCASNYIDCGNLPLYPFGHGLSYSKFEYKNLKLSKTEFTKGEKIKVSVTIQNNSDVAGKETVMLFMRDMVAQNVRPVQQLIAFEKVWFDKNETKTVEFTIDEKMLGYYNNKNEFVTEPGEFKISTGYAENLILTQSLWFK